MLQYKTVILTAIIIIIIAVKLIIIIQLAADKHNGVHSTGSS